MCNNDIDNDDDILCPICYDNNAEYFTECNHKYCIDCLKRLKKCALCNKILQRSLLCQEIRSKQNHHSYQIWPFGEFTTYNNRPIGINMYYYMGSLFLLSEYNHS